MCFTALLHSLETLYHSVPLVHSLKNNRMHLIVSCNYKTHDVYIIHAAAKPAIVSIHPLYTVQHTHCIYVSTYILVLLKPVHWHYHNHPVCLRPPTHRTFTGDHASLPTKASLPPPTQSTASLSRWCRGKSDKPWGAEPVIECRVVATDNMADSLIRDGTE